MGNRIKPFTEEKYAAAQTITSPEKAPLPGDSKLYELPAVMRMSEGAWGLYMLTIRGDRVLDKLKLHGPDIKRVCLAKAIRLLER